MSSLAAGLRGHYERLSRGFLGRFLKNSAWGVGGQLITAAAGVMQVALVTRALGVEQYGVLSVVTLFPVAVQQFLGFRTAEFVARYVTEALERGEPDRAGHIARLGYAVDTLTALASLFGVLAGGRYYLHLTLDDSAALPLMYMFAVAGLGTAVQGTAQALLRIFDKFSWIFWNVALNSALRLGLIVGVYWLDLGLAGVVWAYGLANLALAAGYLLPSLRAVRGQLVFTRLRATWAYARAARRDIVSFLGAGYLEGSLSVLGRSLDQVLVANLGGAVAVGLYRAALNLVAYLGLFVSPLMSTVQPDLQRSLALPARQLRRRLLGLTLTFGSAALAAGLAITVVSPWLVPLVLGAEFAASVPAVRIMVWGVCAIAALFWLTPLMLNLKYHWTRTLAVLAGHLAHLVLLVALVPTLGYLGAAWAYLAVHVLPLVIMLARANARRVLASPRGDAAPGAGAQPAISPAPPTAAPTNESTQV